MGTIGARIRYWRKRRKLTQTELARRVGLHRITVVNYEREEKLPSLATLLKLATALRVPPARLLNG